MKFNSIKFFFTLISVVIISSCTDKNDQTDISTNASFTSLSLANSAGLINGTFKLVDKEIVNTDSLAFGTQLDSVLTKFTFTSSAYAQIIVGGDTSYLTGNDTLNLTIQPIMIRNYAADRIHYEDYTLKVNVHQIEPELYVWKNIGQNLVTDNVLFQKTVIMNNKMYYFYNTGTNAYLSTSTNGINWTASEPVNCPVSSSLNDLNVFNNKFYVTQEDNNILSSTDGITWTNTPKTGYTFKSLLFTFDSKLWAVVRNNDTSYSFANSTNGTDWAVQSTPFPTSFPVSGFSTLSFLSRVGKPKVLVVGGYDSSNTYRNTSWSSEDCMYWVDFSSPASGRTNSLESLAPGSSLIKYDGKLLLFGAVVKNGQLTGSYFRRSIDEGYSWQKPNLLTDIHYKVTVKIPDKTKPGSEKDTTYYTPMPFRASQSVVVNSTNNIYIVGGKNNAGFVKEVWTGKLNRLSFLNQ